MAVVIAISGSKNAGKTTYMEVLIQGLSQRGYKVASVKHDGHDFDADVPGRDSYRHKEAGTYGTMVFSKHKFMLVKDTQISMDMDFTIFFKEADILLLEGFKHSKYPKIEVVREANNPISVCDETSVIAYISDCVQSNTVVFDLDEKETLVDFVENYIKENK